MFMLDDPFLWLLFDFLRQRPRKHLLTTSMSTCMTMTLVEEASLDNLNANVYDYDVGSRGMIIHLQMDYLGGHSQLCKCWSTIDVIVN